MVPGNGVNGRRRLLEDVPEVVHRGLGDVGRIEQVARLDDGVDVVIPGDLPAFPELPRQRLLVVVDAADWVFSPPVQVSDDQRTPHSASTALARSAVSTFMTLAIR